MTGAVDESAAAVARGWGEVFGTHYWGHKRLNSNGQANLARCRRRK
jgi:hypothetical protein